MDLETLKEYLCYNPNNGHFVWLKRTPKNKSIIIGERAGSKRNDGYRRIRFLTELILEHRLAFAFMENIWLPDETVVDHIDGDPSNNKWENLRKTTHKVNSQNQRKARSDNTTNLLGAVKRKDYNGYTARIDGKHLGSFKTAEKAHEAYLKVKRCLHEGNTL